MTQAAASNVGLNPRVLKRGRLPASLYDAMRESIEVAALP